LTVIRAACQQDPPVFIEDRGGTTQSDLAFLAQAGTIENLCHFLIPLPIRKFLIENQADNIWLPQLSRKLT
jgi:hypothetical protein